MASGAHTAAAKRHRCRCHLTTTPTRSAPPPVHSCCVQCGHVLEEVAFSADVTFQKDAAGESTVVGQFVNESGVARGIGRIHGGRVYAYQVRACLCTAVCRLGLSLIYVVGRGRAAGVCDGARGWALPCRNGPPRAARRPPAVRAPCSIARHALENRP